MKFNLADTDLLGSSRPEGWFDKFVTYFINRGICVTILQLAYMCVVRNFSLEVFLLS